MAGVTCVANQLLIYGFASTIAVCSLAVEKHCVTTVPLMQKYNESATYFFCKTVQCKHF